jgi:predicted 3-demethylubiquinone-9 3-methyltransferase (glyoxalase superfamily)
MIMQPVSTCLTFKTGAETAAQQYVSAFSAVFGDEHGGSSILATTHFSKEELAALSFLPEDIRPGPAGSVATVRFLLNGQELTAVNGGNYFGKFNESMSLYVNCDTQEQIDRLWGTFAADAQEIQPCGWVKDRFGVSWQIVPSTLLAMTEDPDRERAQRVMTALYGMKKVDAAVLQRAYDGESVPVQASSSRPRGR